MNSNTVSQCQTLAIACIVVGVTGLVAEGVGDGVEPIVSIVSIGDCPSRGVDGLAIANGIIAVKYFEAVGLGDACHPVLVIIAINRGYTRALSRVGYQLAQAVEGIIIRVILLKLVCANLIISYHYIFNCITSFK